MKKRIAVILMGIVMLFAFAACGGEGGKKSNKLRGTYKEVGTFATGSITFSSDTNMTLTVLGAKIQGTYELKGDKLTLHYSLLGVKTDPTYIFSKEGNSIYLNGTEYRKE